MPRPRGESAAETVEVVAGLSGDLLAGLPADSTFAGVGVGVAGVTRRSDGSSNSPPTSAGGTWPSARCSHPLWGLVTRLLVANEADLGARRVPARSRCRGASSHLHLG